MNENVNEPVSARNENLDQTVCSDESSPENFLGGFKQRVKNMDYRIAVMSAIIAFLTKWCTAALIVRRIICCIILLVNPNDIENAVRFSFLGKSAVYNLRNRLFTLKSPADVPELFVIEKGRGRKSPLRNFESAIVEMLNTNNYYTLQQIIEDIKAKFCISVRREHVSDFLVKHGFKKLKCASIPVKADTEKQAQFYDELLLPLIKKAQNDECILLFSDASHFVMGSDFIPSIYTRNRRFRRTFSGRKRYNVLGALNYKTHDLITITDDDYITATTVIKLGNKIAETYPGKEIHIILDNARYQHCNAVISHFESLGIHLEFLPSYSPNLNLIERVWKLVKSELRKTVYYDFKKFCTSIDEIIASSQTTRKAQFDSLIKEKIQLFRNMKSIDDHTVVSEKKDA